MHRDGVRYVYLFPGTWNAGGPAVRGVELCDQCKEEDLCMEVGGGMCTYFPVPGTRPGPGNLGGRAPLHVAGHLAT